MNDSDKPSLFNYNPETEQESIKEPFLQLYGAARRHFCYRILSQSSSLWEATMRKEWRWYNEVKNDERIWKPIMKSWKEVRPPEQKVNDLIDLDPTLMNVHQGTARTHDVRNGHSSPQDIAIHNLRMWVSRSLSQFWRRRFDGQKHALFTVQSSTVKLEGILPGPLLDVYASSSHDMTN
jgi:hypothetical protein